MSKPISRQSGLAALEFALVLPLLMLLLFGIVDMARALQANVIMVNLSREGANLASRGSVELSTGHQEILFALMSSAPPLNVKERGMVYITRVMGVKAGANGKGSAAIEQYRWDDRSRDLGVHASGYAPASRIYQCGSWNNGVCTSINSKTPPAVAILSGQLKEGELVYVVETFYKFDMLMTKATLETIKLPTYGPDLYSMSVF